MNCDPCKRYTIETCPFQKLPEDLRESACPYYFRFQDNEFTRLIKEETEKINEEIRQLKKKASEEKPEEPLPVGAEKFSEVYPIHLN